MKLPNFIHRWLVTRATNKILSSPPHETLGPNNDKYLKRWFVIPHNRFFNIYIHHFMRSDDDRALHDHPWASASVLLVGHYREHLPNGEKPVREEGHFYLRRASAAHRIELMDAYVVGHKMPVVTLFLTGPHVREWGFLCPGGWRHWKVFTKQISKGKSVGCGDFG